MPKYFCSYFGEDHKGSQFHGSAQINRTELVTCIADVRSMADTIKKADGVRGVVILNWRHFEEENPIEQIFFSHRDMDGTSSLVISHAKTGYLLSLPMDAKRADEIAAAFGKELVHS